MIPLAISSTPADWDWRRLDELCSGIFDCPHSTPQLAETGPYLVRTPDIGSGVFRPETALHVSIDTYQQRIARAEPRYGDLLYSREGTYFGVAAEVPPETMVCLGQRMVLIRPIVDLVDHRYLRYWLNSPPMFAHVAAHKDGSVAQRLNLPTIRSFPIPLPPRYEQRWIVDTLGSLDEKIESNRRAITLCEQVVRAQFELTFDSEHDESGVAISDLITLNAKRSLSKGAGATYVGMSSLPEFSPEVYDWEAREFGGGQKFVNGDVLMARITPCLENGKTAIVDMLRDGEVGWGSTEYIVFSPSDRFSTAWIYCLLRTEAVRAWAIRSMTGTSGRQRFQADALSHYKIPQPSNAELTRFDALARPLFARMSQLRDEAKTLAALRDALLPELLSGRLRVSDAAEVAA